jgi:four helix bundle protein
MTIKDFTDLYAWKEGHNLVLEVYKATAQFPVKETYSLVDQMRRCVVSVTSNIAEGFSRIGAKDKMRFYIMTAGSLTELQNQLIIAKDVKYLSNHRFNDLYNRTIVVHKLVNGLIKSIKNRSIP